MLLPILFLAWAQMGGSEWTVYGGNQGSQRYSPLHQITTKNVGRLGVSWVFQTQVLGHMEATPLFDDGVLYFPLSGGHAYALDARTGRVLWHYRRPIPENQGLCCGTVNRGMAIAGDKLFMVTIDAHLLALDKKTSHLIWDAEIANYKDDYSATAAPLVVKDQVVVGISGGDLGARGFIDSYSVETGKRLWRFWTIPAPGEAGSETWPADAKERGGGSTWVTGSYDPALNLIYWGAGNPVPALNARIRPGDNLYTNSMLALEADTGKLRWHYQFTPHDSHDWDGVNEPILADLTIAGVPRKALLHADRNGFLYALDRVTGKPIWGRPFVKTSWAEKLDAEGRPIVIAGSEATKEGAQVCPSVGGGKNWNPAAYNPDTKLVYVPVAEGCTIYYSTDEGKQAGQLWMGGNEGAAPNTKWYGALRAFDARDGKLVWEFLTIAPHRGSVLTTAGELVFAGDDQGYFTAFHARTGKVLWNFQTGSVEIAAPPITYELDGRQYVAVLAGTSLFTFALQP